MKKKFETPGPASYNYMYPEPALQPSKMQGYSFQKDGIDGKRDRNEDSCERKRGPGTHNPELPRKTNAKTFNSGPDDKMKETKDNGIPGPGTYPE